jgi:hypothetical protein
MVMTESAQSGCPGNCYSRCYGESCRVHGEAESGQWSELCQLNAESLTLVQSVTRDFLMFVSNALDGTIFATFSNKFTDEFSMWEFGASLP